MATKYFRHARLRRRHGDWCSLPRSAAASTRRKRHPLRPSSASKPGDADASPIDGAALTARATVSTSSIRSSVDATISTRGAAPQAAHAAARRKHGISGAGRARHLQPLRILRRAGVEVKRQKHLEAFAREDDDRRWEGVLVGSMNIDHWSFDRASRPRYHRVDDDAIVERLGVTTRTTGRGSYEPPGIRSDVASHGHGGSPTTRTSNMIYDARWRDCVRGPGGPFVSLRGRGAPPSADSTAPLNGSALSHRAPTIARGPWPPLNRIRAECRARHSGSGSAGLSSTFISHDPSLLAYFVGEFSTTGAIAR